MTETVTSRTQA